MISQTPAQITPAPRHRRVEAASLATSRLLRVWARIRRGLLVGDVDRLKAYALELEKLTWWVDVGGPSIDISRQQEHPDYVRQQSE